MFNKAEQILESVKIHLREQRESYRQMEREAPNVAGQRTFKYNDEQNRVTLTLIERLEAMYSENDFKNNAKVIK